jgi:hypothetical protein
MADERSPKAGHAVHFAAVGELAGRIDRASGLARAPRTDGVEVLEREADRIHHLVAARAHRIRAMLRHQLAHAFRHLAGLVLLQRGHIGQRRRGRRAENVLQHPFTADHR